MKKKIEKYVTWYMVTVMFLIGITPRVYAGFSPSEVMNLPPIDRQSDLEKIQKVLESKMVRERLKALGFTQNEIQMRLSQLNEEQIHQLASKFDEMHVGGDAGEVLIVVLLVAILVVLLIYLLGHTVIIK